MTKNLVMLGASASGAMAAVQAPFPSSYGGADKPEKNMPDMHTYKTYDVSEITPEMMMTTEEWYDAFVSCEECHGGSSSGGARQLSSSSDGEVAREQRHLSDAADASSVSQDSYLYPKYFVEPPSSVEEKFPQENFRVLSEMRGKNCI